MPSYALLVLPSANRVYADASVGLTVAELEVLGATVLTAPLRDVAADRIAGVPYITFAGEPTDRDLAHLANVSTAMALFAVAGGGLRPVELHRLDRFDDDLLTILKYQGKTNELFTKLLLNVTVWSSVAGPTALERPLRVLDPMCGRGTTLNQALMYGWHAAGVDVDTKDVEAYAAFLTTWLEHKRLKHSADTTPLRREGVRLGRRFRAEIGATREEWKAGHPLVVDVASTDTLHTRAAHRPATFDVVVTDAPYGVQHGSRTAAGLARSPLDLLRAAVPVWAEVLKPGGAMGIAWNTHVASRDAALEVLAAAGLEPLDDGPYRRLGHRVDQAILRDVLVARRPSHAD